MKRRPLLSSALGRAAFLRSCGQQGPRIWYRCEATQAAVASSATSTPTPGLTPREERIKLRLTKQREVLDRIGQELGIKQLDDWYKVTKTDVEKKGGRSLWLHHLSLEDALKAVYPQHTWDFSKTNKKYPNGYWRDVRNVKREFERIAVELGVNQLADWYTVSRRDVEKRLGRGIFFYHASLEEALKTAYPEYPWEPQRFPRSQYWQDEENIKKALSDAEVKLGIEKPEDWYSVNIADLKEIGIPKIGNRIKLAELLSEKYPQHKWDKVFLNRGKYGQQRRLEAAVSTLFPGVELISNVRKEAGIVNPETGSFFELDLWLPSLNLAFEFQEKHHYNNSDFFGNKGSVMERDKVKKELAKDKGITLVVVPCWWDGRRESLVATIRAARPDLLQNEVVEGVDPIPEEVPPNYFDKKVPSIQGIGQPVAATFFTLTNVDPRNWWMFEKYDGVRGFWNPEKGEFFSRLGNRLPIPQAIIDTMPNDLYLDGELWFGRDNFQESLKISARGDSSLIDWDSFKFMVFDIPQDVGNYEHRYKKLVERLGGKEWKYMEVAKMEVCTDTTHMERFFQDVVDKGGEGIILRDPYAPYQAGRSLGYLKHKKFRDAEAKIIGPAGPYKWECELPNGVRFVAAAGTTEFAKRWTPQPGDIVSFKHHGFLEATGKPKIPTIYRMREDLSWEDVVNNPKDPKVRAAASAPFPWSRPRPKPRSYWADLQNRKNFFLEVARDLNVDPSRSESWKNVTLALLRRKGGRGLIDYYNKSLTEALKQTFPEYNFDFAVYPREHWLDVDNRRKFFTELAKECGFDPSRPSEWKFDLPRSQIKARKGGDTLLELYGSLRLALRQTYPEIVPPAEQTAVRGWGNLEYRRKYFCKLAEELKFDPFKPENWNNVTRSQLKARPGGAAVLSLYNNSLALALMATFPELTFKFKKVT